MVLPGVEWEPENIIEHCVQGSQRGTGLRFSTRHLSPQILSFSFSMQDVGSGPGLEFWTWAALLLQGEYLKSYLGKSLARAWYPFCVCFLSGDCFVQVKEEEGRGGLTGGMDQNKEWQAQLMEIVICYELQGASWAVELLDMEGHSFAPVILTYHNVYLVYSAYLFQLITTVFQSWLTGLFFHFTDTL